MLRECLIGAGNSSLIGEEIHAYFSNDRANVGIIALIHSLVEVANV